METLPGGQPTRKRWRRSQLIRRARQVRRRARRLDPVLLGLIWSATAGMLLVLLNAVMRRLSLQLDPFQTQFLRYLAGSFVMLPIVARTGLLAFKPKNMRGQFVRGAIHTFAVSLWFFAVPHITLADTTAIGFTGPIFIMIGAALVFHERMRWERWLAAGIGFVGVMIVVAPHLSGAGGYYSLVMLSSAPVFAASFLFTKALTRYERPAVIVVWQSLTVSAFSLPLALLNWRNPTLGQWAAIVLCGVLGSAGHYCLTRSFTIADISATQSVKFLDLVWASTLGWLIFGDHPSQSTLIGGVVICASTLWIARRESRGIGRAGQAGDSVRR